MDRERSLVSDSVVVGVSEAEVSFVDVRESDMVVVMESDFWYESDTETSREGVSPVIESEVLIEGELVRVSSSDSEVLNETEELNEDETLSLSLSSLVNDDEREKERSLERLAEVESVAVTSFDGDLVALNSWVRDAEEDPDRVTVEERDAEASFDTVGEADHVSERRGVRVTGAVGVSLVLAVRVTDRLEDPVTSIEGEGDHDMVSSFVGVADLVVVSSAVSLGVSENVEVIDTELDGVIEAVSSSVIV